MGGARTVVIICYNIVMVYEDVEKQVLMVLDAKLEIRKKLVNYRTFSFYTCSVPLFFLLFPFCSLTFCLFSHNHAFATDA